MNNSLPYKVEYCVGEQNCRKCEKKIRSGCLKVAIMMQVIKQQVIFDEGLIETNFPIAFSRKMTTVSIPNGII